MSAQLGYYEGGGCVFNSIYKCITHLPLGLFRTRNRAKSGHKVWISDLGHGSPTNCPPHPFGEGVVGVITCNTRPIRT